MSDDQVAWLDNWLRVLDAKLDCLSRQLVAIAKAHGQDLIALDKLKPSIDKAAASLQNITNESSLKGLNHG